MQQEKKCNCYEPYNPDYFQAGYPYCPIHEKPIAQRPAGAVWVKASERFPVKKHVVAKKFISHLNREVVGTASSATGEMICFDWGVSSVCLAIGHEELNNLFWLDENKQSKEGNKEREVAFAEWAGWEWIRVEGKSLWENQKTLEVLKSNDLYERYEKATGKKY